MDKIIEKGFKKEDNKDNEHRVTCTSLPNTHKHTILKTILKKTKIINPKQIIIIIIKKEKWFLYSFHSYGLMIACE